MSKKTPTLVAHLGRYEYKDDRSNKYWDLSYNKSTGLYIARWGRIGASPQMTEYDTDTAFKKVREKVAKGYRFVTGSGLYTIPDRVSEVRATLPNPKPTKVHWEEEEHSEEVEVADFLKALAKC